jgi:DNA (cytosine-5)-methyltransferase 1
MAQTHTTVPSIERLRIGPHRLSHNATIELDSDDDAYSDSTNDDDDDDEPEFLRELSADKVQSDSRLPPNCTAIHPVTCDAGTLRPGCRVELDDGSFLHVVVIYRDNSAAGKMYLKGNLMRRTKHANAMLELKRNELFYVLQTTSKNQNPSLDDCLVTRALDDVICTREIIITNQPFPACSWRLSVANWLLSDQEKEEQLQLVCRWKFTDELDESGRKVSGGSMRCVSDAECDRGAHVSQPQQLQDFLGEECVQKICSQAKEKKLNTTPAHLGNIQRTNDRAISLDTIDLTGDGDDKMQFTRRNPSKITRRLSYEAESVIKTPTMTTTIKARTQLSIQGNFTVSKAVGDRPQLSKRAREAQRVAQESAQYTYADVCAGAGGMTSGAQQARLKVRFVLDNDPVACETLKRNYPGAKVVHLTVHDFCISKQRWWWEKIDVLHISYPCQPHSYLNRLNMDEGNNPKNIDTLFATLKLLTRCKPRIVTFEQTSHIVTKNNGDFFHALVHHLTSAGYNVRWRICNLAEYRNVQPRKRLIILASCPGETLPTFPEAVNGLRPKEPPVTTQKVLGDLEPHKATMPHHMRASIPRNEPAYKDDVPLRRLITCDGGNGNLHPTGKRTFELCELAALQAFLPSHQFAGGKTAILKQIGNAVPSCFAKILFEHVTASLKETDRKIVAWKEEIIDLTAA